MKKVIISFLLISCGAGVSDFIEDLGNGYQYIGEGSGNNFILGKNKIDAEIVCYVYNQHYILALQYPDYDFINSRLGEDLYQKYYFYNKLFVSKKLKKEEIDPILYNSLQTNYSKKIYYYFKNHNVPLDNGVKTINYKKKLADSLIHYDIVYKRIFKRQLNYWIIDKKRNQLFGPYNQEEYFKKKKLLEIKLELKQDGFYPERIHEKNVE